MASSVEARETYSPIRVKIQLTKTAFELNEPLEGHVILTNGYPANLPALFDVQLFQDGKSTLFSTTEIRTVRTGKSRYTLQEFGVPAVLNPGRYRLVISQHGVAKPRPAQAFFKVIEEER